MQSKNLKTLDLLEKKLHLGMWRMASAMLPTLITLCGMLGIALPLLAIVTQIETLGGVPIGKYFVMAGSLFLVLCVALFAAQSKVNRRYVSDRWFAYVAQHGQGLHDEAIMRLSKMILEEGYGRVSLEAAVRWINSERARDPSFKENLPRGARMLVQKSETLGGRRD
jgi:hypothetical protein